MKMRLKIVDNHFSRLYCIFYFGFFLVTEKFSKKSETVFDFLREFVNLEFLNDPKVDVLRNFT